MQVSITYDAEYASSVFEQLGMSLLRIAVLFLCSNILVILIVLMTNENAVEHSGHTLLANSRCQNHLAISIIMFGEFKLIMSCTVIAVVKC